MRLGSPHDGAEIHEQIRDPYDCEPEIGIPLWLGILFRLGDAEQIAGTGDDDEEIVAKHDEPRGNVADETCATSALDHVERCSDQDVAAESKDDGGGVQRPQPTE